MKTDRCAEQDPLSRFIQRKIPWAIHGEIFSHQCLGTGAFLDQGWKLHVAATPVSAMAILDCTLDVLFLEGVRFKVVRELKFLRAMNAGEFGLAQIGKFISIYPSDDAQAVRLAIRLDEVTRELRGPRVPSDRPLCPDSLVHYRYGAMYLRPEAVEPDFQARFDLLDTDGRLTNDLRLPYYVAPGNVRDPFEQAGAYIAHRSQSGPMNGRYLVVDALSITPRGGIFRALDLVSRPARICVLKEYWHDVCEDQEGRDARYWAQNEVRILTMLSDEPGFPRIIEQFDQDSNTYVAIDYRAGRTIEQLVEGNDRHWTATPLSEVVAVGLKMAKVIATMHSKGIIYRDLKPGNIVKGTSGTFHLIDFGIACDTGDFDSQPLFGGTPDFCSPEQFAGERPDPADDIFAWGAVLHFLACGEAPFNGTSGAEYPRDPFPRKPVAEFNGAFPPLIGKVIDRAVAWERNERFHSMIETYQAFDAAICATERIKATTLLSATRQIYHQPENKSTPVAMNSALAFRYACQVGDALCSAAEERAGGLCWATRGEFNKGMSRGPEIYSGAAGIGLFLAELANVTGELRYADAARGAALWLAGPEWGRGCAAHGLYGGEPGIAFFFLRLAQLLNEPSYVVAADLRLRRLRGAPIATLDLLDGAAGTILSLLRMYSVSGDSQYLSDAITAGKLIAKEAIRTQGRGVYWEVAHTDKIVTARPYLGLLHGAAGIGLALNKLGVAANNEEFLNLSIDAAAMLLEQAQPEPANSIEVEQRSFDSGYTWPHELDESAAGSMQGHCHGAGGVGQFFLRLDNISVNQQYQAAAVGAGHALATRITSERRSCACHGISGMGNFFLDCYQELGDSAWLELSYNCGQQLLPFSSSAKPGIYSMSQNGAISPDLMLGYAGVGGFMLRLAKPDTIRDFILG